MYCACSVFSSHTKTVGVSVTEMAREMALDDVLAHHELERKDLEFRCTKEIRDRIARKLIGDWYLVGRAALVTTSKLDAIRLDLRLGGPEEKAVAMLDAWNEDYGEHATCFKLAEALYDREKLGTIEILCRDCLLYTSPSPRDATLSRMPSSA